MLNALWGTGKSHVWQNELKPLAEKKQLKIIEINVFGLSTRDEITKAIIDAIFGLDDGANDIIKKTMKVAENALGHFSETKLGNGLSSVIGSIAQDQAIRNLNEQVLIVIENLERSVLDKQIVLATISQLIEEKKVKALFITDESKIEREANPEYYRNREKVIGTTWNLEWDEKEFFEILMKMAPISSKELLESNQQNLNSLTIILQYPNIRTWISAIRQVDEYIDLLRSHLDKTQQKEALGESYLANILIYIVVTRVYINKLHQLNISDIESISLWPQHDIRLPADQMEESAQDLKAFFDTLAIERYMIVDMLPIDSLPSAFTFITEGHLCSEALQTEIDQFTNIHTFAKGFINDWINLENEQFSQDQHKLRKHLEKGEITSSLIFSSICNLDAVFKHNQIPTICGEPYLESWEEYLATVIKTKGFDRLPTQYPESVTPLNVKVSPELKIDSKKLTDAFLLAYDSCHLKDIHQSCIDFWESVNFKEIMNADKLTGQEDFENLLLRPSFVDAVFERFQSCSNADKNNIITLICNRIFDRSNREADHPLFLEQFVRKCKEQTNSECVEKYLYGKAINEFNKKLQQCN